MACFAQGRAHRRRITAIEIDHDDVCGDIEVRSAGAGHGGDQDAGMSQALGQSLPPLIVVTVGFHHDGAALDASRRARGRRFRVKVQRPPREKSEKSTCDHIRGPR